MATGRKSSARAVRAAEVARGWQQAVGGGWDGVSAAALYADLEQLMEGEESAEVDELAESISELAVYLCSFVETSRSPTDAQRAMLGGLVERLRQLAEESQGGKQRPAASPNRAGAVRNVRIAFYLCDEQQILPGLPSQLGRAGFVVRPLSDADAVAREFSASPADVLILDRGWLQRLSDVLRVADKARGDLGSLPLVVILGDGFDELQRGFALRGGADALLTERDPLAIVQHIEQLMARRRDSAWRVLVIDDDRQQALFCETVLRHRGLVVESCQDPLEAEERIANFRPDLVLLDLYMPQRNGIEVAQRIRQHAEWSLLPLVFVSGESDLEKRFDAIRMGGDDYVVKPMRPKHLIDLVDSRIRHSKQSIEGRGGATRREDRRGVLTGRQAFVDDLLATRADDGRCSALVALQIADLPRLRSDVDFVELGKLNQQIAAVLGTETETLHPVCAAGELTFLAVCRAESEGFLRQRLKRLHQRLEQRPWGSSGHELNLRFQIVAQRNDGERRSASAAINDVLNRFATVDPETRELYELGRADADAIDPAERILQTLMRGELPPKTILAQFLPLLPVVGRMRDQYFARYLLMSPTSPGEVLADGPRWLTVARRLERVAAVDRQLLRHTLRLQKQYGATTRLYLPVAIETVLDPTFAPWLMAEVQSLRLDVGGIVIAVDAAEASANPNAALAGIDAIQVAGARVMLSNADGMGYSERIALHGSVDSALVAPPSAVAGQWQRERGNFLSALLKHGKRTIAGGVEQPTEFSELLRLKFDYATSERFAGWRDSLDFDFDFDLGGP